MAIPEYRPYDPNEIQSIRLMLEAENREGKQIAFEVKVNGLTRIHKTSNVERFDELYNFINEHTKELVISVYPDARYPNRKEWYKFSFTAQVPENLNGVEVEQRLSDRMRAFEEKMAAQRTEEKLKETQEQLQQAEEYIAILEDKLEGMKAKPNHFGGLDLGKLAGSAIESIALHYPKILDKVPVLNGIAKVIQEDAKSSPKALDSFEGDVSFKEKTEATQRAAEQDEHEEVVRQLTDFIGEHFDEQQRKVLGLVIVALGENPSQLQTVAELLGVNPSQTEQE